MADSDPSAITDIDQKIRLNELKEEIREVTGRGPEGLMSPECTPELEEESLRNMLAYESSPLVTPLEQVTRSGFELPETERLDDAQISAKLADLIARLGGGGPFYITRITSVTSTIGCASVACAKRCPTCPSARITRIILMFSAAMAKWRSTCTTITGTTEACPRVSGPAVAAARGSEV